jgi:hypothetical protein
LPPPAGDLTGELARLPDSFVLERPVEVLADRPERRVGPVVGVACGEIARGSARGQ